MAKSEWENISEQRHLLQNPYAFIEDMEERRHSQSSNLLARASEKQVSASRELLENPYAHIDGAGGYSALTNSNDTSSTKSSRTLRFFPSTTERTNKDNNQTSFYSDFAIESKAKDIHKLIWQSRKKVWRDAAAYDPVEMLDPAVALGLLGFEYQIEEGLGQYRGASGMLEVAGLIDRSSRTVRISGQFPVNVRTFTAAHELGHAVLHPNASGVHRDKPMDGCKLSRERAEAEADKFATLFLMPAKLVKQRFGEIFGSDCFVLNEETSFALSGRFDRELQRQCRSLRDLSRLLASVERYDGRQLRSLATQFHVSIEAMAIRLEELGLLSI